MHARTRTHTRVTCTLEDARTTRRAAVLYPYLEEKREGQQGRVSLQICHVILNTSLKCSSIGALVTAVSNN